jgi:hypothetical protein
VNKKAHFTAKNTVRKSASNYSRLIFAMPLNCAVSGLTISYQKCILNIDFDILLGSVCYQS